MGGRIIAGVIGFVVLVLLIQNYVLGDDDPEGETAGRTGAAPTATLPAQTPEAISLGDAQQAANGGNSASGTTAATTYVVQAGDTLNMIAASFNVAPEAQAEWISEVLDLNGIADARLLQAGQELQVPRAPATSTGTPAAGGTPGAAGTPAAAGTSTTNPIVTATPAGSGDGSGDTYVVLSGDTPLGIAAKFCVEARVAWVNELVALNGIDASNLDIGQELELPTSTPPPC